MKKKDTKGPDPAAMNALLEAAAEKEWGQELEMSNFIKLEEDLAQEMIEKMAAGILKAVLLNGYRPVFGGQKIRIGKEFYRDATTIAAKLRAAMSATPNQFIAFCGFKMYEAAERAESAERYKLAAEVRFEKALAMIRASSSLSDLKSAIEEEFGEHE